MTKVVEQTGPITMEDAAAILKEYGDFYPSVEPYDVGKKL